MADHWVGTFALLALEAMHITVLPLFDGPGGGQQGFDLLHLHNVMAWGGASVGGYLDALYTFLLHGGAVPPHAHTT